MHNRLDVAGAAKLSSCAATGVRTDPVAQQRGNFPDPLRRNGTSLQHPPIHLRGLRRGHALLLEDAGEEAGVEVVLLDGGEGGPLLGHAVAGAAEAVVPGEGFHQGGGAFIS
jgi:hypothetical protein